MHAKHDIIKQQLHTKEQNLPTSFPAPRASCMPVWNEVCTCLIPPAQTNSGTCVPPAGNYL